MQSRLTQGGRVLPLSEFFRVKAGTGMEKKSFLSKLYHIIFAFVVCAFIAYLIYISLVNNIAIFNGRPNSGYETVTDYTCTEIKDDSAPAGVIKEYRFVIAEISEGDTHLIFYTTHQYSETYIDGELVYSIVSTGANDIKTVGSNWIMIPISAQDAGKEVTVRITPVYKTFIYREVEFMIGSDLAIYTAYLAKNLPQLVLCFIALFVGIAYIVVGIWYTFREKKSEELMMLGLFSVMVGVWRLTDNLFTPFMFSENPTFTFYCSNVVLMLVSVPFIKSVSYRYNRLSRTVLDLYCIVALIVSFIQLILQISGVADIREYLTITHIVIVTGVLLLLANYIYNRKIGYRSKHHSKIIIFSPFICIIGAIIDLILFYFQGSSAYLLYTLVAFVIFTTSNGIRVIVDYGNRGRILADQEKELLNSRVLIMLSQIKPHFLYNSLSSISELCVTDPERARNALIDFADYLRGNMDSIGKDDIILFSKELKHIECYLNLEKIRFGNRLKVVYDIRKSDFWIPTLTIQPLVENAVKYGVCAKKEGGTVTISTRQEDNKIIISVTDDGVGFERHVVEEAQEKDERSHIGLANVEKRLAQLVGGSLTVNSEKGKGTVVQVVIENTLEKE